MVKTRGSALGLSATGTIGQALTFSSWKGTAYLKTKSLPRDPHTHLQLRSREILRFLSAKYSTLTDDQEASWATLAELYRTTHQNAYIRYNTQRFHRGSAPTEGYPATETGTLPMLYVFAFDAYHNVRSLKRDIFTFAAGDTVGYMIWYDPDNSGPWEPNAHVYLHDWQGNNPETIFIPSIEAGHYHLNVIAFTSTGKQSAPVYSAFCDVYDE